MPGQFFRALLGRGGTADGAPDQAEAEAMIAELSAQLPNDAPAELRAGENPLRFLKGREQAAGLAAWFCRIEDVLASRAQDPHAFRADFRERAAQRWPRLASLDEMAIAFSSLAQLEATLCRFFLREAAQRARDVLGAAGGGKLAELMQWLETGLDGGVAPPFAVSVGGAPPTNPVAAATACSRGFYAWLDHSLGRRAEAIYENAYQRTARQFGAADAFHVVIGLMPDKLITADKLSLLRRGQIEQVLREKIVLLEQANVDAALAKEQAEKALVELKAAQQNLIHAEKMASLGQLTAGVAHEIKNPLNFVNNFAHLSIELLDELKQAAAPLDQSERSEIDAIIQVLAGNLEKIAKHGKRADGIVKSMLAHSRESSDERRPVDLNALVEESLNLSYHGARAEKPGFNITLIRDFDPNAGDVDLYPQEFTRVLLNLISNGFYAAMKRKTESGGASFEPVLTASTKNLRDKVEIRIRDNGVGVSPEIKTKMFTPFFTTKPTGEGTGLGLSLSYDIVVTQHGGTIDVDTKLGDFTEFVVVLPRGGSSSPPPKSNP
jgi:signal transduction histidine kinase